MRCFIHSLDMYISSAGLFLTLVPFLVSSGLISSCMLSAIDAFFLIATNALGNVIMMEVLGMHRYAMEYGFSLFVSGSTPLCGYPLLGK